MEKEYRLAQHISAPVQQTQGSGGTPKHGS